MHLQQSVVCDVRLRATRLGKHLIALPRSLLTRWSIQVGSHIRVKLSCNSVVATVQQAKNQTVLFSNTLGQELHFHGGKISARKVANGIEFGPVVALYVVGNPNAVPPFPNMTRMLADTIQLGEDIGVYVYALIPGGISVNGRTAYGARGTYDHWVWEEQPFPDILIRKAVTFPKHLYPRAKMDLTMLERENSVMILAKDIGDKWSIHRLLWKEKRLRRYLPHTKQLLQRQQLLDMLKEYKALYLKPLRGTQGNGIYKMSQNQNQASVLIQGTGIANQVKTIKKSDLLNLNKMKQQFPFFKQPYLLQQALDLLQYEKRVADFRWVLQKIPEQEWGVTARICRVGKTNTITTNIHKGGQAVTAEQCLEANQALFVKTTREIINEMDTVALDVAKTINGAIDGVLELGVDLGVDRCGSIWIIEVNPRPGRKMLRLCQPETRQLSLLRPLEYAKYAKGF